MALNLSELILAEQRGQILKEAQRYLADEPVRITDAVAARSPGGPHDYYSNGDYWWPNPHTPDQLPFVRRDGESNPGNFQCHRKIMRKMRTGVATLAAAFYLTGNENFAKQAFRWLREFFLDDATRMNPHLLYAQAIPGIVSGRGIGIIDTLHLIEIPIALRVLQNSEYFDSVFHSRMQGWFADYLKWMTTHPYGLAEMNAANNHAVAWLVQVAVFAQFTGHPVLVEFCRTMYKTGLLPKQMAADGSFPQELERTKPYSYSIFNLDCFAMLCQILSTATDDLWRYCLDDGRGIAKGFEFLYPFLADKTQWRFGNDVEHFDGWPVRIPGLVFAGGALNRVDYLNLWRRLPEPRDLEVRRNIAIRQPLLWLGSKEPFLFQAL